MAHESDVTDVFTVLAWIGKIFVSAVAGAYSAYKWFCGKLDAVETNANAKVLHLQGQLDALESDSTQRMGHMDAIIQAHATRLAVGEKDFENFREKLDAMMDGQKELARKQDRTLEILVEMRRGKQ